MSKAICLNDALEKANNEIALPEKYSEISSHNLYIYVKSYLAGLRSNTATAKGRSEVRGGGKKPWSQKGRGGARAGSRRSPIWVGGGKAFGPTIRNYNQKVNKKQKALAFNFALNEKAANEKLYVVDSVKIESGKTKDAQAMISKLNERDILIVVNEFEEKTYLAFRNLKNVQLIERSEVNPYWLAAYSSVVIEKAVFENMVQEG
jgi:large subunit ribosomal protein L4